MSDLAVDQSTDIAPSTASSGGEAILSNRVRQIRMSATIAMAERAATLKHAGKDIISLALGELDFATPRHVIDAAHNAAQNGFTRYTAPDGAPIVKEAVREKLRRDNSLVYGTNEIHVAAGCKQVIYNALASTINPGDEVIVFSPYWVSYVDMVEFCGGIPRVVATDFESGFLPDPAALAKSMSHRTKWVLLNSPNNPTGAVYPRELLAQLAAVAGASPNTLILSDEIYEHLVFDGNTSTSLGTIAPELRDRSLIVNGVSKSYAMTGWRIGFAAGPEWLIRSMAKVQSQTAGNASSISQAAAAAAMTGDQNFIPIWRSALQRRRDAALEILRGSPWLRVPQVPGAFYIFVDVARCIGAYTPQRRILETDLDFADYILDEAGVAVVAGGAFGASPYVRLSFALDDQRLREACRRIVVACDSLASG